ncbi:Uncharacterised protein [Mycolicibacterium vanbaalenii]|uniref:Uncharacterized protein n=2 Tax=Mycolicibacterium vanbaalenii TaxID=110539 RepID=A0A5S9R483_MYCVN|nr:Uncharacterised protein [Mycolicibacterium vanbaalenii]
MNPVSTAKQISRWTNLGIELPDELTAALDRFEALQYVEVGHRPTFDLESVTAENAEEKVREFAKVLANHIPMRLEDGVSASVLESSKSWALNAAAIALKRTAAQSVPQIIDALEPEFEEHAEAYAEAALALPETITSDTLVKAGPDALAAYGVAKEEAAYIGGISSWISQTSDITGVRSTENFLNVVKRPRMRCSSPSSTKRTCRTTPTGLSPRSSRSTSPPHVSEFLSGSTFLVKRPVSARTSNWRCSLSRSVRPASSTPDEQDIRGMVGDPWGSLRGSRHRERRHALD